MANFTVGEWMMSSTGQLVPLGVPQRPRECDWKEGSISFRVVVRRSAFINGFAASLPKQLYPL